MKLEKYTGRGKLLHIASGQAVIKKGFVPLAGVSRSSWYADQSGRFSSFFKRISFLVKTSDGRQVMVRGYKTLEEFEEIISCLTDCSRRKGRLSV